MRWQKHNPANKCEHQIKLNPKSSETPWTQKLLILPLVSAACRRDATEDPASLWFFFCFVFFSTFHQQKAACVLNSYHHHVSFYSAGCLATQGKLYFPSNTAAVNQDPHPPICCLPACLRGESPLSPAVRTAGGVMDGWMDGCVRRLIHLHITSGIHMVTAAKKFPVHYWKYLFKVWTCYHLKKRMLF